MNAIPDAEALYIELLRGVKSLMRQDTRLIGITSGGAWLVERLQKDLGDNYFLLLRNHGLLTVGRSIADAFLYMYIFETACQIQIAAQSGGAALTTVHPAILDGVGEAVRTNTMGLGGELVWPALLRKLERVDPGYRS